jgi:LmbE family N-acetylglucosaminyl deacetylase
MNPDRLSETYHPAGSELPLARHGEKKDNLLVVSPHPDDDVLGAGGTMALASEKGQSVFAVYVTDGRGSPRKNLRITDEETAARRQQEALSSLRTIGGTGGFFLRRQSRELTGRDGIEVREEIREILERLRPAEIYLPAPYERHRTHQACTALTIDALRAAGEWPLKVFGYGLWGSFWGGKERVARDVGAVIRRKVEAVAAHASQIEYKNYHQGILGKNNYEAVFWESHEVQKASFLEIFVEMTEFVKRKDLSIRTFIQEDVAEFMKDYLPIPE